MIGPPEEEEALQRGNASVSVVRVGDTVRKPWLSTTERAVAFMTALREQGVDVPEPRGRDEQGGLVIEFVPGQPAINRGPPAEPLIHNIGAMIRTIHDASTGLARTGGP